MFKDLTCQEIKLKKSSKILKIFNDCLMDAKNKSNKKSLSSLKGLILLVPGTGLEPVHSLKYRILSPACLPVPPPRH